MLSCKLYCQLQLPLFFTFCDVNHQCQAMSELFVEPLWYGGHGIQGESFGFYLRPKCIGIQYCTSLACCTALLYKRSQLDCNCLGQPKTRLRSSHRRSIPRDALPARQKTPCPAQCCESGSGIRCLFTPGSGSEIWEGEKIRIWDPG